MEEKSLDQLKEDLKEASTQLVNFIKTLDRLAQSVESLEKKNKWVPLSSISSILGKGFTSRTIKNKIEQEELTYGIHYISTSNGKPHYLVNPKTIEDYFRVKPEYRS